MAVPRTIIANTPSCNAKISPKSGTLYLSPQRTWLAVSKRRTRRQAEPHGPEAVKPIEPLHGAIADLRPWRPRTRKSASDYTAVILRDDDGGRARQRRAAIRPMAVAVFAG